MTFLKTVFEDRQFLVEALRRHPGLRKVVEQCYPDNAHFIYELLQNAEDAGASEASFELQNDCLIFTHDGTRAFTETDVWSITDYGESSLSGQIGKFGVGFKSVFAYSETPRIYCRTFSFELVNLVQPRELTPNADIGNETRFEFPFNNPKRPCDRAFNEINRGLNALSESTLLFLSNLRVVHWQINDGPKLTIRRIDHLNDHIQIESAIGTKTHESSHWLRFSDHWTDQDQKERSVAIAFAMAFVKSRNTFDETIALAEQVKIIPASPGKVFVFFPAVGVTSGLRFHVHAPFATDVSRANVNDEGNGPLYERLSHLAASSLHKIRDKGLLTEDFLAVLPTKDDVSPRYMSFRDAITKEMNEKPLTPTRDKQFAPARQLVHIKDETEVELKNLLSSTDLEYFFPEITKPNWVIDVGPGRQKQFLESLAIHKWGIDEFQRCIAHQFRPLQPGVTLGPIASIFARWLSEKTLLWHQQFYAVLKLSSSPTDENDPLAELRIVRLQNGDYAKGGDCKFPTDERSTHSQIKIVAKEVYSSGSKAEEQRRAKEFLVRIGVKAIQETDVIKDVLKTRYSNPDTQPDDDTYVADLKHFVQFLAGNKEEHALFSATYVFMNDKGKWVTPNEVFLDCPAKRTWLSAYYDCLGKDRHREPLGDCYFDPSIEIQCEKFISFAEAVGVQSRLKIVESRCQDNPQWDSRLSLAPGKLTKNGFEQDYYISDLQRLLKPPSLDKSRLIWQTMCYYARNRAFLKAIRQMNSTSEPATAFSRLVYDLRHHNWVPQDGGFVKPAAASRGKLPPSGFPFDYEHEWLRAIEFGVSAKEEAEKDKQEAARKEEERQGLRAAATKLGFPTDTADLLTQVSQLPGVKEKLQQLLFKNAPPFELPQKKPTNRDLVTDRAKREALNAPRRGSEPRTRLHDDERDEVKKIARDFLQDEYTNPRHQKMICQICQDELPFKYRASDGTERYFFEAVELFDANQVPLRQYQNYLALCPNHAAMFGVANDDEKNLRQLFENMKGQTLAITLAKKNVTVYFTESHLCRLRAILDLD